MMILYIIHDARASLCLEGGRLLGRWSDRGGARPRGHSQFTPGRSITRAHTQKELIKNSLRATSERYYRDLMAEPAESIECHDGREQQQQQQQQQQDGLPAFASSFSSSSSKASRVPPIRVTISRDYSLLNGRQVQIEVADEGGGCVGGWMHGCMDAWMPDLVSCGWLVGWLVGGKQRSDMDPPNPTQPIDLYATPTASRRPTWRRCSATSSRPRRATCRSQ
jgi:hypothetical protein